MDVNFTVPEYVVWWGITVGFVIAWSLIGAVVGGLLHRFGYEGDDVILPGPKACGAIWPLTCLVLFGILFCLTLKWTVLLPARFLYKHISGER